MSSREKRECGRRSRNRRLRGGSFGLSGAVRLRASVGSLRRSGGASAAVQRGSAEQRPRIRSLRPGPGERWLRTRFASSGRGTVPMARFGFDDAAEQRWLIGSSRVSCLRIAERGAVAGSLRFGAASGTAVGGGFASRSGADSCRVVGNGCGRCARLAGARSRGGAVIGSFRVVAVAELWCPVGLLGGSGSGRLVSLRAAAERLWPVCSPHRSADSWGAVIGSLARCGCGTAVAGARASWIAERCRLAPLR